MVDVDFVGNRVLFEDSLAHVDQTRLHSQPPSNFTKVFSPVKCKSIYLQRSRPFNYCSQPECKVQKWCCCLEAELRRQSSWCISSSELQRHQASPESFASKKNAAKPALIFAGGEEARDNWHEITFHLN
jgi:hypothetical protein